MEVGRIFQVRQISHDTGSQIQAGAVAYLGFGKEGGMANVQSASL